MQAKVVPRFEFGFGLSYTTFDYSGIKISGSTSGGTRQPIGPGTALDPWLHDPVVTVAFTVTNNGTVAGTEARLHVPMLSYSTSNIYATAPIDPAALHVPARVRPVCAVQFEGLRQHPPRAGRVEDGDVLTRTH